MRLLERDFYFLLNHIRFFFFNHWSTHLFQSNQRFQAIEFVDRTVREKLYIFCINLPCMALVLNFRHAEILISSFHGLRSDAWDHDDDLGPTHEKKKKCAFSVSRR